MERLTVINGIGEPEAVMCMACNEKTAGEHLENCGCCICWQSVINRLAAYEDTGLEPEEVQATKYALMGRTLAQIKEFNGVPIKRLIELAIAEIEKGVNGK